MLCCFMLYCIVLCFSTILCGIVLAGFLCCQAASKQPQKYIFICTLVAAHASLRGLAIASST